MGSDLGDQVTKGTEVSSVFTFSQMACFEGN